MNKLSLVGKLMDISFCDKQCSNVNNNEFKGELIEFLENQYKINNFERLYNNLMPTMFRCVSHHQHLLATLTNGTPYLLYMTRVDNVNCCFYIDRKLKNGYSYPKIHCVKYRFHDSIFNDTIFSGELIRDSQRNWYFLLSDILVHKGQKMDNQNIIAKFQLMNTILKNEYVKDTHLEVCPLQVKRLFMYRDVKKLFNEYIPNLSYTCRGIVFYTLSAKFSNYAYQFPREKGIKIKDIETINQEINKKEPSLLNKQNTILSLNNGDDDNQENLKMLNAELSGNIDTSNSNDSCFINDNIPDNNVVFNVIKGDITDIYHLYCYDKTNKFMKYDYAYIPNLSISKKIKHIFKEKKDIEERDNKTNQGCLKLECQYSQIFDKWTPINLTNIDIYTITKIDKIKENLNRN
jgi:hypothetical protein